MLFAVFRSLNCKFIFIVCVSFLTLYHYEVKAEHVAKVIRIASGLTKPVYVTHSGDNSNRLFIVENSGKIRVFKDDKLLSTPFLDIEDRVRLKGRETGLLGMAFHPDYINNGRFFLNYTIIEESDDNSSDDDDSSDDDGSADNDNNDDDFKNIESTVIEGLKTVIAEYRVSNVNPDVAEIEEKIILTIDQPTNIHNGGQLQFGHDGYLYIGVGDGGPANDLSGNGQNINTLLGAILRIDVNHEEPFSVPLDNPFVGKTGADEIYAYGFRNPWRFSFDRLDGRLFVGDVGQRSFEEVDLVEAGGNYGWSIMEANHCFSDIESECDQPGLIAPILEYSHSDGQAVVGGYVYRGIELPVLQGSYLFTDFGSGVIWTLDENKQGEWERTELLQTGLAVSSLGEDQNGELYVIDYEGAVYKLVDPLTPDPTPSPTPIPTIEPTPTLEIIKPLTLDVKCNKGLIEGINGRERLFLNLGENASCFIKIANFDDNISTKLRMHMRSTPVNNIRLDPDEIVIDQNGEFKFTVTPLNEGYNWIEWFLQDRGGNDTSGNGLVVKMYIQVFYK